MEILSSMWSNLSILGNMRKAALMGATGGFLVGLVHTLLVAIVWYFGPGRQAGEPWYPWTSPIITIAVASIIPGVGWPLTVGLALLLKKEFEGPHDDQR
jgi:hypothetical protein